MKKGLKKLFAALLCVCVLTSTLSVCFTALAEETQAPTVAGTLTLGQYAAADAESYWSFTATEAGCYLFSSNVDEDTWGDLYDGEMNLLADDDDSGDGYNFQIAYNMQAGETVYLKPRYLAGKLIPCKIIVERSSVKSIELYEMDDFVFIEGDCNHGSPIDDWFLYTAKTVLDHIKLLVTYNDNSTRIIADEAGVGFIDNQEETHWVVGSDNKLTVTYQGQSTVINVTVVESPLKEIELVSTNNFAYVENDEAYGSPETGWHPELGDDVEYFFYDDSYAVVNSTFKLIYKDETEKTVEGFELLGAARISNGQSCENPWVVGENADAVTLNYLGREIQIPVTVVENTDEANIIASVSARLHGRPIIKNDERVGNIVDAEAPWFHYEIGTILEDTVFDLTYSSGRNERIPLGLSPFSDTVSDGSLSYIDPQSAAKPWKVGDNSLLMSYKGVGFIYTIPIIETDVKSIKVIDDGGFVYIEGDVYTALPELGVDSLGYWNSVWYRYRSDVVAQDHITLEVTYLDGTVEQVKYFNPDNTWSGMTCSDTQTRETPWTVGGENLITIKYRNATTTYNAKLVENPLADTDYEVAFLPEGTIALSHYRGNETNVTLPTTLGDYRVTSLERGLLDYTRVQSVTIPAGMNTLTVNLMGQPFSYAADLKSINVAADHTAFSSVDGVLMSKDKTVLLAYPIGKSKSSYTIPAGVTEIGEQALASVKFKSLFIPASVTKFDLYAFGSTGYITQVFYGGSEAQWKAIYDGEYNEYIYNAGIHYNATALGQHKYTKLIKTVKPTTSAEGYRRYQCERCTAYIDTSIAKLINLSTAKISGVKDKTYTGKAITQSITVKVGSKTLKKGTDYTVSYSNNTKAGTAKLTIKAKGSVYGGSKTVSFTIKKKSLKSAKVSGIKNKAYTGKKRTQSIKVKLGSKTLKKNRDYTVSYKNNTKTGKATLYVKGKGNYSGTVTKTFIIYPKKQKISSAKSSSKKKMTVKWTKDKRASGYQIVYATNSKFTKGKKAFTVKSYKTYKKTISKLKSKKTYYVKVRSFKTVSGKKYYGSYSKTKKVKIK